MKEKRTLSQVRQIYDTIQAPAQYKPKFEDFIKNYEIIAEPVPNTEPEPNNEPEPNTVNKMTTEKIIFGSITAIVFIGLVILLIKSLNNENR